MEPVTAILGTGVVALFGYLFKRGFDAQEKAAERALKEKKLEARKKEIEKTREENKKLQEDKDELKRKWEEQEKKNKEAENKINNLQSIIDDPNASEEDKKTAREQQNYWTTQLDEGKKLSKTLREKIEGLENQINNNNEIISKMVSNMSNDDKNNSWVQGLFTLENIVIAGGCYMAYKLLRDDRNKF